MNKVKPTRKQLKTIEIKQANPDMPLGRAMMEAGYSEETSKAPKQKLVESRGFEIAMEQFKLKLTDLGITPDFMAEKYKEWLTAKKPFSSHTEPDKMIPDYQTQLAVKDDLKKFIGVGESKSDGLTRKLTIEEFIAE